MPSVPPFLEHLGLTAEADVRAVRRAYARELRRIDLEQDPRAFQVLREAYELALRWVDARAEQGAGAQREETPDSTSAGEDVTATGTARSVAREQTPPAGSGWSGGTAPGPESAAADALPDPASLAEAVLGELTPLLPGLEDEGAAQELLRRGLADPRLLGLEARDRFERSVADRLADGWQPGHELLFPAAIELFEWGRDRRRLDALDAPGNAIDRAMLEALLLEQSQSATLLAQSRELLARLRSGDNPGPDELYRLAPVLERLATRHPGWLRVMAPWSSVVQWRTWSHENSQRVRKEAMAAQVERPPPGPWLDRNSSGEPRPPGWRPPGWRPPSWRKHSLFFVMAGVPALVIVIGILVDRGPEGERSGSRRPPTVLPAGSDLLSQCLRGDASACLLEGQLALRRRPYPDPMRAASSLRQACNLGNAEGCHMLADLLEAGREVSANPSQAAALHGRACDLGDWSACRTVPTQSSVPP